VLLLVAFRPAELADRRESRAMPTA
jgi:hypothetical protein